MTPVRSELGMKEENSTRISIDCAVRQLDYYCCVSHHFVTYQQNLIQSAQHHASKITSFDCGKYPSNCKEETSSDEELGNDLPFLILIPRPETNCALRTSFAKYRNELPVRGSDQNG